MADAEDISVGASAAGSATFTTTHWSVVLAAADLESPQATEALEKLCRTYWYPLYAYVRHRGYGPEDAQDLTQAFFAHLLNRDFLRKVRPNKGLFRSFLLACLKHFLADEWKKAHRAIRGGTPAASRAGNPIGGGSLPAGTRGSDGRRESLRAPLGPDLTGARARTLAGAIGWRG